MAFLFVIFQEILFMKINIQNKSRVKPGVCGIEV